jgi:two-component system cell cycle sensor histidine kinase/response regulator CckA
MQHQASALQGEKPARILVLEDNETARFVFRAVLEPQGYQVVDAIGESEALRIFEGGDGCFDLLIADVVLRTANGTVTAKRIAESYPKMPILFTSGFPLEALLNRHLLTLEQLPAVHIAFLAKPFSADQLLNKVRQLVASSRCERE